MPTNNEHMIKYNINKNVLETALDVNNKQHYDWITTICFYASLHIIEAEFAKKSIDNRTHIEREDKMRTCGYFSRKVSDRYKQLSTYSKVARYGPGSVTQTIVSQSLLYLRKIEEELLLEAD